MPYQRVKRGGGVSEDYSERKERKPSTEKAKGGINSKGNSSGIQCKSDYPFSSKKKGERL